MNAALIRDLKVGPLIGSSSYVVCGGMRGVGYFGISEFVDVVVVRFLVDVRAATQAYTPQTRTDGGRAHPFQARRSSAEFFLKKYIFL
jgi:hypothetical protein